MFDPLSGINAELFNEHQNINAQTISFSTWLTVMWRVSPEPVIWTDYFSFNQTHTKWIDHLHQRQYTEERYEQLLDEGLKQTNADRANVIGGMNWKCINMQKYVRENIERSNYCIRHRFVEFVTGDLVSVISLVPQPRVAFCYICCLLSLVYCPTAQGTTCARLGEFVDGFRKEINICNNCYWAWISLELLTY